jgi:anthranilate phosphoribosyltransferase
MTDNFLKLMTLLRSGKTLLQAQADELQTAILADKVSTEVLLEIFSIFDKRRLAQEELAGFFAASNRVMAKIPVDVEVLDTCGTGGDQSGSFNISTVAAVVCAASGVPVAKHGNRAASSQCGSADVLESLGVNIELKPKAVAQVLRDCGFVFLYARNYHPAFKYAAEARKIFAKKTYFNLLGPLLNPAGAGFRAHGLADFSYARSLGVLLIKSGAKRVWLMRALDGLDEISPFNQTQVVEFVPHRTPKEFMIDPQKFGLLQSPSQEIKGGDCQTNAKIFVDILQGHGNQAQNAAVMLNAAAGLTVAGRAKSLEEGIKLATHVIVSGKAYAKLQEIIKTSNTS